MATFKRNLHLGTKDPLIETDDINNGATTWDKLSDDVKEVINSLKDHIQHIEDTDKGNWDKAVCSGILDKSNNLLNLLNNAGKVVSYIDITELINTGLLKNVTVRDNNLVLVFVTAEGDTEVLLPIQELFSLDDYYTKAQTDERIIELAPQTALPDNAAVVDNITAFFGSQDVNLQFVSYNGEQTGNVKFPAATKSRAGIMSAALVAKLNIAYSNAASAINKTNILSARKPDVIEITDYMTEAGEAEKPMPWFGLFTYNHQPVSQMRIVHNDGDDYDLLFSVHRKWEQSEDVDSELFIWFYSTIDGWVYMGEYTWTDMDVDDVWWIARAFGEENASAEHAGRMSAQDKIKLDNLSENSLQVNEVTPMYNLCKFARTANLRAASVQELDGVWIDPSATSSNKNNYIYIDKMSSDLTLYTDRNYSYTINGGLVIGTGEQVIRNTRMMTTEKVAKLHVPYSGMLILWMGVTGGGGNSYVKITTTDNAEIKNFSTTDFAHLDSPIVLNITAGDYYIKWYNEDFFFHSASILKMNIPISVFNNDAGYASSYNDLSDKPVTVDNGNLIFDGKVITFNLDGTVTWTAQE